MMKFRSLRVSLLIACLATSLFAATSDEAILEQSLTSKAQQALDRIYGERNFVVDVDVDMTTPRYEVKYTEQAKPRGVQQSKKSDEVNVLPGYPVIKNLAPESMSKLPFDSVTTYVRPVLLRTRVKLVVNKDFSKSQAGRAKEMVSELLALQIPRDSIEMTFKPFYSSEELRQAKVIKQEGPTLTQRIFVPSIMVTLGLAAWFSLLFLAYMWMQSRANAKSGRGGNESSAPAPTVSVNPNFEIPESANTGGGAQTVAHSEHAIKRYFDFINDQNVEELLYLIRSENMSVENISIIVSFLPARLGAKIMGELDLQNQATITTNILSQRVVNRAYLDKLEGRVRDWLECLVGGKSSFVRLFSYVSGEVKKQLMGVLGQTNQDAYRMFRESVIIFDDLRYLSDDELKFVLSESNIELLSTALVSVDDSTQQKINSNLTQSAKEMIRQYLDLKGKTISKRDIEAAQDYVINIVNKLEAEGKINLRSKISG